MRNEAESVLTPTRLKGLLVKHGVTLKKHLGQNFLVDANVLIQIVDAAEIEPEDGVFEIGPGAGVVTRLAALQAKKVVAVEKDKTLRPILQEWLDGLLNVDVRYEDVLKVRLAEIWTAFADCQRVSVIANLPYYITTPILFHLLDSGVPIANLVIMVQKEVADRLMARPGGKDYGALTVAVQYRTQVETVLQVGPGAFVPPPAVDSTVVRLRVLESPKVSVRDEDLFFRVVRGAFATRRKTLLNALTAHLGLPKASVKGVLETAGVDPLRRGETLSIEEFASIADLLAQPANGNETV